MAINEIKLSEIYSQDYLEKAELKRKEREKLSREDRAESKTEAPALVKANTIGLDLYLNPKEGSNSHLVKAFDLTSNGIPTGDQIRTALSDKLEKGIIDQDLYNKAIEQLDNLLVKAEGSRGGHVIRHTRSGKPVYKGKESGHKDYKDFTASDHGDAASFHREEMNKHDSNRNNTNNPHHYEYERALVSHHEDVARQHAKKQKSLNLSRLQDQDLLQFSPEEKAD